jgi:hypothetical protein
VNACMSAMKVRGACRCSQHLVVNAWVQCAMPGCWDFKSSVVTVVIA